MLGVFNSLDDIREQNLHIGLGEIAAHLSIVQQILAQTPFDLGTSSLVGPIFDGLALAYQYSMLSDQF